MNMNEIYETLQGMNLSDISQALSGLEQSGHSLTQTEIIALAAMAAAGLLLCLFGLKIVRFWAALLGLTAGFSAGFTAAEAVGGGAAVCIGTGLAAGIVLAVLGSVLYRVGVFVTVFLSVTLFCFHAVTPDNWIITGICLAAGLIAAVLAMKFLVIITIAATALLGAVTAGPAVSVLLPDTGMDGLIRILLCTLFGAAGVLVQLLLESKKRKKQNLQKAAEIRETASTANEVERARAVINDLDTMPAEDDVPGSVSSAKNIEDDPDFRTINLDDI